MTYERENSVVSTSSSSLGSGHSGDSISAYSSAPPSLSRRGRGGRFASRNSQPPIEPAWSSGCQMRFEERIIRITTSAGFPLSWVENPEWLDFCTEFVPQAKSPIRKVLTRRLLPQALAGLQSQAKNRACGKNATASCDGWTGENFHHYIAFMVMVDKEVCTVT
jgi:hypothetical protein